MAEEYKYIEEQIKGARDLAEKHKDIQTYQDILDEHIEVLRKAKAFDEVLDVSSWNAMDVGDAVHSIVREYEEEK